MSLEDDPVKVEAILRGALKDAEIIFAKLDEFEISRNQKLLSEVTNSLKGVMASMRTVNPKGQRENVQLQNELKTKMKDLVDRTKNATQTATSASSSSTEGSSLARSRSSRALEPQPSALSESQESNSTSRGRSARALNTEPAPPVLSSDPQETKATDSSSSSSRVRSARAIPENSNLSVSSETSSSSRTRTVRAAAPDSSLENPSSVSNEAPEERRTTFIDMKADPRLKAEAYLKSRAMAKTLLNNSNTSTSNETQQDSSNIATSPSSSSTRISKSPSFSEGNESNKTNPPLSPRQTVEERSNSFQESRHSSSDAPRAETESKVNSPPVSPSTSTNSIPNLVASSSNGSYSSNSEERRQSVGEQDANSRNRSVLPPTPGRISEPPARISSPSDPEPVAPRRSRLGSLRSGLSSVFHPNSAGQNEEAFSSSTTSSLDPNRPKLRGWLKKQGEDVFKGWKKRYFSLIEQGEHANCLAYSNSEHEKPNGFIEINQFFHVAEVGNNQFDLDVGQRVYHLQAASKEELKFWLDGLRAWHKNVMREHSRNSERPPESPETQLRIQKEAFERRQEEEKRRAEEERVEALRKADEVRRKLEERKRREEEEAEVRRKQEEERHKLELERQKEDEEVRAKMKQLEEENRIKEQIQIQQKTKDQRMRYEQEEKERQQEQENQRKHAETMATRMEEERIRLAKIIEEDEEKSRAVTRARLEEEKNSKKNIEQKQWNRTTSNSKAEPMTIGKERIVAVSNGDSPKQQSLTPPTQSINVVSSAADKEKIRMLEEKVAQLEKLTLTDVNRDLFFKLQEELSQKERQYDVLRSEHKANQEERRIAEEQRDNAMKMIKELEEENKGKDHHIRRIQKKLKQARREDDPNLSTSPMKDSAGLGGFALEIEQRDRTINKLKETIWAHQQQNATVTLELNRIMAENTAVLRAKDETIDRLEKELLDYKELHSSMREKYVEQQLGLINPKDSSILSEMQKLKKVYFFSVAISTKLNYASECNVNVTELYETALGQNIDWKQWSDWIPNQIIKK